MQHDGDSQLLRQSRQLKRTRFGFKMREKMMNKHVFHAARFRTLAGLYHGMDLSEPLHISLFACPGLSSSSR